MISLGPEPDALLLRPRDIMTWVPGLDRKEWVQIRGTLHPVFLPGCRRPYYRREEVRAKLVRTVAPPDLSFSSC